MSILPETKYATIFSGSAIRAQFIQEALRSKGINSIIANDGESAARAGFGASYELATRLLVKKEDVLQANHCLDNLELSEDNTVLGEDFTQPEVSDIKKNTEPQKIKRSKFNLFINALLIVLSIYRLFPLLQGESLPIWRITISLGILIFCSIALYNGLKK